MLLKLVELSMKKDIWNQMKHYLLRCQIHTAFITNICWKFAKHCSNGHFNGPYLTRIWVIYGSFLQSGWNATWQESNTCKGCFLKWEKRRRPDRRLVQVTWATCLTFNFQEENSLGLHCAGALLKWLWEETHVLKGVGSNPNTVYWMDIFHIYLL